MKTQTVQTRAGLFLALVVMGLALSGSRAWSAEATSAPAVPAIDALYDQALTAEADTQHPDKALALYRQVAERNLERSLKLTHLCS